MHGIEAGETTFPQVGCHCYLHLNLSSALDNNKYVSYCNYNLMYVCMSVYVYVSM